MGVKTFNVMSLGRANLMNPEQLGYQDSIDIIRDELQRTRRSFVKIGWYLKHIQNNEMYREDGYANIYEFAAGQFHLSQPTATRFMQVCEQFSVNHNSPELDEKYIDFNMSQLFEMLPMKQEEIEKVTPDMKVSEIRKLKKEIKEPVVEKDDDNNIPGQTSIEEDFKELLPDSNQQTSKADEESDSGEHCYAIPHNNNDDNVPDAEALESDSAGETDEKIIDGEYREIEGPYAAEDEDAIKQPDNVIHNETGLKEELPKKCITGWSRYGVCSCCGNGGVQCCKECEESCNSRCGWIDESYNSEDESKEEIITEVNFSDKNGLSVTKYILEQEKKTLNEFLEVGGLPEMTVLRQKTIVGALAAMVCDLEDQETELDEPIQPELPLMKNNDQRKEWLGNYKAWGIWYRDEHIDVNYYKYDFSDGSRLVVTEYPQRYGYWNDKRSDEHYYHLLEKNKKSYKKTYDEQYRYQIDSETYLLEFIKNLQRKEK